jgi:hypothetical protein
MKEHGLLWAFLPEGLEEYFDVESFEKDEQRFRIVLVEKNILPTEMPAEYHGKKVINTVLNDIQMDDFSIRGRKADIVLRRRWWKFEGVQRMLMRSIDVFHESMRFSKEFAAFLKDLDRKLSSPDQPGGEEQLSPAKNS